MTKLSVHDVRPVGGHLSELARAIASNLSHYDVACMA